MYILHPSGSGKTTSLPIQKVGYGSKKSVLNHLNANFLQFGLIARISVLGFYACLCECILFSNTLNRDLSLYLLLLLRCFIITKGMWWSIGWHIRVLCILLIKGSLYFPLKIFFRINRRIIVRFMHGIIKQKHHWGKHKYIYLLLIFDRILQFYYSTQCKCTDLNN